MESVCAQTRPRFILSSKRVWGNGFGTHVNLRGKVPSTAGSEEERTCAAASRRAASPTHYQLSYSGPGFGELIQVSPCSRRPGIGGVLHVGSVSFFKSYTNTKSLVSQVKPSEHSCTPALSSPQGQSYWQTTRHCQTHHHRVTPDKSVSPLCRSSTPQEWLGFPLCSRAG